MKLNDLIEKAKSNQFLVIEEVPANGAEDYTRIYFGTNSEKVFSDRISPLKNRMVDGYELTIICGTPFMIIYVYPFDEREEKQK